MNKIAIVAIVGIAFLAGGVISNADLIAEATGGDASGAWAKLVARVTALEQNPAVNAKYVQLQDDSTGNAAGWNPDGFLGDFTIDEPAVTEKSLIVTTLDVEVAHTNLVECIVIDLHEGIGFDIFCFDNANGNTVPDGATLNYSVTNPP